MVFFSQPSLISANRNQEASSNKQNIMSQGGSFRVGRIDKEMKNLTQNAKIDFSEYMWMEDMDNYDREIQSEIEEENYIRNSIELLLDEEERDMVHFTRTGEQFVQGQRAGNTENPHQYNGFSDHFDYMKINQDLDPQQFNGHAPHPWYNHGAQTEGYLPYHNGFPQPPMYHQNGAPRNGYGPNTPSFVPNNQPLERPQLKPTHKLNPNAEEFRPGGPSN